MKKLLLSLMLVALTVTAYAQGSGGFLPTTTWGWISFILNIGLVAATPWIVKNRVLLMKAIPVLQILIDAIKNGGTQGLTAKGGEKDKTVMKAISDGERIIAKAT